MRVFHQVAHIVCCEEQLIIEVDGSQHMDVAKYAQQRTKDLEAPGYKVIRFWNNEVHNNIYGVMESILNLLESVPSDEKPSSPALLPFPREKGVALCHFSNLHVIIQTLMTQENNQMELASSHHLL